jgi:hypothetical protein
MRKWLLLIVAAALTVAVVVPTQAGAASKTKCSLNLTTVAATVRESGMPPLNGTATNPGIVDGKLCGKRFRGADRAFLTFLGLGKNTVADTVFGPLGSFKSFGTVHSVLNPDGSVSGTSTGKITGGTGLYRGATGSISAKVSVPAPPNDNVITVHATGTIKF